MAIGTGSHDPDPAIADEMMTAILGDLGAKPGSEVLLLVNGHGGTPAMELYLMLEAAKRVLDGKRLKIARWSATTARRLRWPAARSR